LETSVEEPFLKKILERFSEGKEIYQFEKID